MSENLRGGTFFDSHCICRSVGRAYNGVQGQSPAGGGRGAEVGVVGQSPLKLKAFQPSHDQRTAKVNCPLLLICGKGQINHQLNTVDPGVHWWWLIFPFS